jgi:hypothetical protein
LLDDHRTARRRLDHIDSQKMNFIGIEHFHRSWVFS